ncbi:hypothetical protein C8Q78DRAFT_1083628 [Trametes maxima]|nr:hypothetical protein C8Q78DRAFT_1083628 [Trametes maxima]
MSLKVAMGAQRLLCGFTDDASRRNATGRRLMDRGYRETLTWPRLSLVPLNWQSQEGKIGKRRRSSRRRGGHLRLRTGFTGAIARAFAQPSPPPAHGLTERKRGRSPSRARGGSRMLKKRESNGTVRRRKKDHKLVLGQLGIAHHLDDQLGKDYVHLRKTRSSSFLSEWYGPYHPGRTSTSGGTPSPRNRCSSGVWVINTPGILDHRLTEMNKVDGAWLEDLAREHRALVDAIINREMSRRAYFSCDTEQSPLNTKGGAFAALLEHRVNAKLQGNKDNATLNLLHFGSEGEGETAEAKVSREKKPGSQKMKKSMQNRALLPVQLACVRSSSSRRSIVLLLDESVLWWARHRELPDDEKCASKLACRRLGWKQWQAHPAAMAIEL